jgi:mRNA interferase RelE/StbE
MANYEIVFKQSVAKDLRSIPCKDVRNILERIEKLAENPRPRGCVRLAGRSAYRIRQGLYRIIYEILDKQVVVQIVTIGHRCQVYR